MTAALRASFASFSLDTFKQYDLKAKDRFHKAESLLLDTIFSITTKRFSGGTARAALQEVDTLPGRISVLQALAAESFKVDEVLGRLKGYDLACREQRKKKETSDLVNSLNLDANNHLSKLLCKVEPKHVKKGIKYLEQPLQNIFFEYAGNVLNFCDVRLPEGSFMFFEKSLRGESPGKAKQLGLGSCGYISSVPFGKDTFALKRSLPQYPIRLQDFLIKEGLAYMLLGKHDNIASIYAIGPEGIYLQLAEGDLEGFIEKNKYSLQEAKIWLQEIAGAVLYIHSLGRTYKDLKLGNVLYVAGPQSKKMLLCDFGFVTNSEKDTCLCGNEIPPEMYLSRIPYSQKVDSWAFGILIYQLIAREHPFGFYGAVTPVEIATIKGFADKPCQLTNPYPPSSIRYRFIELAKECLHGDPSRRLSMQDIATRLNEIVLEEVV